MGNYNKLLLTLGLGGLALILQFVFKQQFYAQVIVTIIGAAVALIMFKDMIKTLKSGKYGVDILAITAIVATLAVGEYWASLMILIMLTGGDSLEDYAAKKARRELKSLLDNSPQIAHLQKEGELFDIDVNTVKIGDHLVVKPGELVAVDGSVIIGESDFDESSLTGESRPVTKRIGDSLMSGSVNGDTSVTMIVQKVAADSQYQQIVKLVKESEAKPAQFVRLADRYAVPFTLIAYTIAGLAWFISKDPKRFAEVLVVASPCPLILAAPIALVSGMSRSSRNGIIIKTGTTIEKLARTKSIAFDKTGTMTNGRLEVAEIVPESFITKDELLLLAASSEQQSSHILARSLVSYADKSKLRKVEKVSEKTGAGVLAQIGSDEIKVGKLSFVAPETILEKDLNQTVIFISINDKYAGYITFSDKIRPESKETVAILKANGVKNILMITGDRESVAEQIAEGVGITKIYADCLPEDKINIIKQASEEERPIIMVGDGVNDAPALTVADIGIAMGAHGSTSASESADVVILLDDLSKVAKAVVIAKKTMKIAKESVLIGIAICVVLMVIASFGVIPALFGALLQEVVDTVSILYALRARK